MAIQDMTIGDWFIMYTCFAIAAALLACWSRSVAGGWPWTPDDVQPEGFSTELRERLEHSAAANKRSIDEEVIARLEKSLLESEQSAVHQKPSS